jgi:hypothetical protein
MGSAMYQRPGQPLPPWKETNTARSVAIGAGAVLGVLILLAIFGGILRAAGLVKPTPTLTAAAAPAPTRAAASVHAAAPKKPAKATAAPPPPASTDTNANVPGFSGAALPATNTEPGHLFGECLHSWWTQGGSGPLRVHVQYPGPALINVDPMPLSNYDPPPNEHQYFVMPYGQPGHDLTFPRMPHLSYVQIQVMANTRSYMCDASKGP